MNKLFVVCVRRDHRTLQCAPFDIGDIVELVDRATYGFLIIQLVRGHPCNTSDGRRGTYYVKTEALRPYGKEPVRHDLA